MISQFLRNQEAVIATLAEENHKLSMLTTAECDKLQNLEMILQPYKYVFLPVISMFYTVHTPLSTPFGTPSASIPLSLSHPHTHTHTHLTLSLCLSLLFFCRYVTELLGGENCLMLRGASCILSSEPHNGPK